MNDQQTSAKSFYRGNAIDDDIGNSGWFIGQFVTGKAGLRHQTALEIKWGVHPRGQSRPDGAVANGVATTVSILVRGVFRTFFTIEGERNTVTLEREGDYIVFGPAVTHDWQAVEDCVVLSVRFPSVDVRGAMPALLSPP